MYTQVAQLERRNHHKKRRVREGKLDVIRQKHVVYMIEQFWRQQMRRVMVGVCCVVPVGELTPFLPIVARLG